MAKTKKRFVKFSPSKILRFANVLSGRATPLAALMAEVRGGARECLDCTERSEERICSGKPQLQRRGYDGQLREQLSDGCVPMCDQGPEADGLSECERV